MRRARPLRRTIQREIEDALSEKILFGEITAGEIITVDASSEEKDATFSFVGHSQPREFAVPMAVGTESATGGSGGSATLGH